MSLAVDASSPTAAIGSGATTVTGAFTPPDNTLLVAFCQGDANNASLDEDQTVVDSTSTTWTKKVLRNGNGGGCVTVHYRRIVGTSPGSITATQTDNKGSVAKRIFPRVFIDVASGIAPDIGATAVSGSASVSVTTTVNNSWVWSTGLTANATLTAGTGCTLQDNFGGFDSGDAVFTQSQTALTTTAGTNVTNAITGTATVPHNVAVEIIPGTAGTAVATPGPAVYTTTPPRTTTQPLLLRSTLQDPPVLTTPQPIVMPIPGPPTRPGSIALYRSTLADPTPLTTPGPLILASTPRPAPAVVLVLRSSLVDAVLVTAPTPQPLIVAVAAPRPATSALILRGTLVDPPVLTTPAPIVVAAPAPPTAGVVALLRSSLVDVVVTTSTPQPLVVTPATKAIQQPPVLLLRSSLTDPATPGPIVVAATAAPRRGVALLLRSTLADAVTATAATPQPIVVATQQPRITGRVLLLTAPGLSAACDCLVHRPNTGTTAYNRATTGRPTTGTTARPCTC